MKKVLITGGTGFIGRHCLPLLLAQGYEVHATYANSYIKDYPEVAWHKVDLLDTKSTSKLVMDIQATYLLHFAWFTTYGEFWSSPENHHWMQASYSLIEQFVLNGGQRVVVAGSCAEYDWKYGICSEQLTPLVPATLYGSCKHGLQLMLNTLAKENQISWAWGRIFYLYGPHENPSKFIPYVINTMLEGKPVTCKAGSKLTDYMYVEDVASAFVALLESDFQGPLNIASGTPVYLKDIVEKIAIELGDVNDVHYEEVSFSEDNPAMLIADNHYLKDIVGWEPHYDLDTGLKKTIKWKRENN